MTSLGTWQSIKFEEKSIDPKASTRLQQYSTSFRISLIGKRSPTEYMIMPDKLVINFNTANLIIKNRWVISTFNKEFNVL